MDFIFSPDEKRNSDIALEETFLADDDDKTLSLVQKVKHETKNGEHTQHEAIRAAIVGRLFDYVDEVENDAFGDDEVMFGTNVAYNTLFHYGFLKTV